MDRIAQSGVSFQYAFTPGATCIAARAATFTGMYAHNTGVYSFNSWAHHRTWIHDLRDAGYWCTNIGKMHHYPIREMQAFHERFPVENLADGYGSRGQCDDDYGQYLAVNGQRRPIGRQRSEPDWHEKFQCVPWHLEEHLHQDVFVGNSAVGWIRKQRHDHPLFVQIGFVGPHEPYDPLPRHLELYQDKKMPPPVFRDGEFDEKPPQHRAHQENFGYHHRAQSTIRMDKASLADIENMRRHYCAKITTVDEQVGRVLQALEERDILQNSIVFFFSDHGDLLGDHKLPYKWLMYDPVVRVPLIVWDARQAAAPLVVNDLVSLMDIGPTVLEAAGIEKPTRLEGRSLVPYLRNEPVEPEQAVICEDNYLVMLRTREHKMVYYIGQQEGELYDLIHDPDELYNRWNDPVFFTNQSADERTASGARASQQLHDCRLENKYRE